MRRPSIARPFFAGACIFLLLMTINAGIAIAISRSLRHEASAWPGSSFTFWPEKSWSQVERRIRQLPESPRLERAVMGEVSYKEVSFPIHLLRFQAVEKRPQPLKVLLISGVHGTETAGVEALLRFAETIAGNPRMHGSASIDIIPVLNPWGWVYGYRYNGDGEDVNRDFSSNRTREAALLRDHLETNRPWDLVLDLHESKKNGYFIYQYLPLRQGLGHQYVKILKALGKPRESSYREGGFRARDGILRIPAPTLVWTSLARRLSLEQYARMLGIRHAYTVETPVSDAYADRVTVHGRAVEAFLLWLEEM